MDDSITVISVIIPARNEEACIARAVESARSDPSVEVIVVDGGSEDGTLSIVRSLGCRVIESPPGRGLQMNAGAAAATGQILLFLHADTILPQGYGKRVRETVSRSDVVAGAFRLRIDSNELWGVRWIERTANWRSEFWQLPYGDQAIFLAADCFYAIGGYPDEPLLEDVALIRKLQARGRIELLADAVRTSPRRWEKLGVIRTTIINSAILIGYFLGVSPQQLVRWYSVRR